MDTLTVPVQNQDFRRRSLSNEFTDFKRRSSKSCDQKSFISSITNKFICRRTFVAQIGSAILCLYIVIYINFSIRQRTTKSNWNQNLDLCALTAKSANIYNDLKQFVTTGSLRSLSPFRFNDPVWQQYLLQSIDRNKKFKTPFANNSYPTKGNMRVLVEKHKKGQGEPNDIINAYPFKFVLKPTESCKEQENSEKSVYIVFIIKSSVIHFEKRETIRNTWANERFTEGYKIKRVFLLGQSGDDKIESKIQKEAVLYDDILQIDFMDNYKNNTWKTRGGLKWVSELCFGAKYTMLVDDDYYVATDFIIHMLELTGNQDDLYMGWVNGRPSPFRSKFSKWYISKDEYPYPFYPPFVSAGAVLMSMDFVINVNIASLYTKHFVFDDVFLAIVANKLLISPTSNKLFFSGKIPYINNLFESTLACHGYDSPSDLYNAWATHMLIKCYGHNIVNHFLLKSGNKRSQQTIRL